LDVFACHGGMTGMLLTGVFASKAVNSAVTDQGLIFGETTFIHQLTAMIIVSIFAFSASYFLFFVVNKITPLRVKDKEELGLDISQHGEFYNRIYKNL
jgi:Amt family ammonium transporter